MINRTEIFHISLYAVCFVGDDDHEENTHACRISHSHFHNVLHVEA